MHNRQHEPTRKELKKQIEELKEEFKEKLDKLDETYTSLIRTNENLRDQILQERKQRLSDGNYKMMLDRTKDGQDFALNIRFDMHAVRSSNIYDFAREIGRNVEATIVRKFYSEPGKEYLNPNQLDTKAWDF